MTRYHWFVLTVAALGWLFDCLDQQLFNLARKPAMETLLATGGAAASSKDVDFYAGLSTCVFLAGWATGGLIFGVIGDKIGRAKTMMITILIYSLCTGLSALSTGFWDFAFYRFITGLGVGGEFAVGVALVAEVMPDRARPYALGLLQALSALAWGRCSCSRNRARSPAGSRGAGSLSSVPSLRCWLWRFARVLRNRTSGRR